MRVKDVKNELKQILETLNNIDEHNNHLELANIIFKNMMYKDIIIEGYEVNYNILNFWYYFALPTFINKPSTKEEEDYFSELQDKLVEIMKDRFIDLIFKSSPRNKFYTDNGIALDKYIMDNIAVYGESSIILEKEFTNIWFKQVIFCIILGTYKLTNEEGIQIMNWLAECYLDLGKVKSYIVM